MKTVWRVDDELLTITEVDYNEKMPIGYWLPAFVGDGGYAYFEHYDEAKDALLNIIDSKIEHLMELRKEF